MKKKTGIMFCACALAGAAVLLWIAGGHAVASEAVYPLEKTATWFQRNVSCRIRTLWRRQSYAAENARLRRENDILRMALAETEPEKIPRSRRRLRDGYPLRSSPETERQGPEAFFESARDPSMESRRVPPWRPLMGWSESCPTCHSTHAR